MSKPANAVELIDRYLQAVRFWLPKGRPQEDLLSELGEDLRSQIEARESELGRRLELNEVSDILKRCGAPILVASRLSPKNYLIGPGLFPVYIFVLKMVLLWILVPVFVFIVGPATLAAHPGEVGKAIVITFGNLWSGLFIAAGIITLVFAVLERTAAIAKAEAKWDPLRLPPVHKHELRKPSAGRTVCELAFNFFGLIWLLLLPQNPILVFGPAAGYLRPGPIWHNFYLPIVGLVAFSIFRCLVTLAQPQWAWFPVLGNLLQNALALVVLKLMLAAAGHFSGAAWHPFVMVDPAATSAQSVRVSAVVNASILLALLGAWIGIAIAVPIQTWQFIRLLYKRNSNREQAAPLHAQ